MTVAAQELTERYAAALRDYLSGGGEAALLRAYELGRQALAQGGGVLEMAALHQEALVAALLEMLAPHDSRRTARRASEFFAEALASFEMNQRGFAEANAILRGLNRELQERVERVLGQYREARRTIDEQRRIDQLKDDFISIVSHELRTPLTSIHASLRLMQQGMGGELGPDARQLVDVAARNSQRLVRLVDEILDLRKIEAGAEMEQRPVDVRALLAQALEANRSYAEQHGVRFVLEDGAGLRVLGDAERLMQVLANLLSNAVKYSPPGEAIVVSAERRAGSVRVAVRDRGPGIPAEFRERIFQKFAQADTSTSREKGGTGLGLSITKAIVERLGGRIDFDSEPGQGSAFYFELPEHRIE